MSGCGRPASTAVVPSGAGVWRVGWWRWGFVGTLLGPEGAGPGAPPAGGVAGGFFVAGPVWLSYRPGCSPGAGGGGGLVAVCWLRTAQWTRASLPARSAFRGGVCWFFVELFVCVG